MTREQIESLDLGITPIDNRTMLVIEAGLDWVSSNTTLEFDKTSTEDLKALPACVRLFLTDFFDIQMLGVGVSSESIEGMSQSYGTTDKNTLIWQSAEEKLGDYLKSRIRFVAAQSRWS